MRHSQDLLETKPRTLCRVWILVMTQRENNKVPLPAILTAVIICTWSRSIFLNPIVCQTLYTIIRSSHLSIFINRCNYPHFSPGKPMFKEVKKTCPDSQGYQRQSHLQIHVSKKRSPSHVLLQCRKWGECWATPSLIGNTVINSKPKAWSLLPSSLHTEALRP